VDKIRAGFALCGSFCTITKAISQIEELINNGVEVTPIMSTVAYSTDTRFGEADEFIDKVEKITSKKIIHTLVDAEPIGPKKMFDILIVEPCTGNTLAKLAGGIADSPVTLSVKAHLRNDRPVLIGVSTNDALGTAAKNIGLLLNNKNLYFVPMKQDDCVNKPNSVIADFGKTYEAMLQALNKKQLQPILS